MKTTGLRIGLVGPLPPPFGGMANQMRQLEQLLRDEGVVVELIQVNSPYRPQWAGRIKGIRAVFRLFPYLIHLWQSANKVQLFHVFANSGWSWHLFAAPAIWIARLKKKPIIINYRGGEADAFFDKDFFWVRPSLYRTNAIIVPSGFLEAVFQKRGFSSSIVPNIIDLSRFSVGTNTKNLSKTNSPNILVARNLELIYDNATALRAFSIVIKHFPSAQLTITGSGPERQTLENLVVELGLQDAVTFTGRVDNNDMAALYQSSDIMVNPSLADNMPISVLEALASGVPVVSTNVGGVPFLVVHDNTALLVPVQDPTAMADAILALLNNPIKARQIRSAGLNAVKNYSWPEVRSRLLAVYENVLRKTDNFKKEP
jgi:glycosyltransferase involved in cell wall biosynthesis